MTGLEYIARGGLEAMQLELLVWQIVAVLLALVVVGFLIADRKRRRRDVWHNKHLL